MPLHRTVAQQLLNLQGLSERGQEFVGEIAPVARLVQLGQRGDLPGVVRVLEKQFDPFDVSQEVTGMPFFKSLFKAVGTIGRSLLGLPAAAKAAVRAAPRVAAVGAAGVAAGGLTAAALAAGGAAPGAAGAAGFVVNPATGELVAPGGGNGVLATTTMVTTVNRLTGQIVKQRVFVGSPFIMNKEVAHLKSTIKKLRRGAGKIPTRTREPSLNSEINSAIKHSILHQAQRGAALALGTGHKDG